MAQLRLVPLPGRGLDDVAFAADGARLTRADDCGALAAGEWAWCGDGEFRAGAHFAVRVEPGARLAILHDPSEPDYVMRTLTVA